MLCLADYRSRSIDHYSARRQNDGQNSPRSPKRDALRHHIAVSPSEQRPRNWVSDMQNVRSSSAILAQTDHYATPHPRTMPRIPSWRTVNGPPVVAKNPTTQIFDEARSDDRSGLATTNSRFSISNQSCNRIRQFLVQDLIYQLYYPYLNKVCLQHEI